MAKYSDGYSIFDEEEVWDIVHNEMTWDDYEEYFKKMDFSKFFDRVKKLPGFYEEFEDEFCEAETEYLDNNFDVMPD